MITREAGWSRRKHYQLTDQEDRGLTKMERQPSISTSKARTVHLKPSDSSKKANEALRRLAETKKLPLLDIYAEMERRKTHMLEFLQEDGIHLTWNQPEGPPTEENFLKSGYLLRCCLTVRKGMEVKKEVFDAIPNPVKAAMQEIGRSVLNLWRLR